MAAKVGEISPLSHTIKLWVTFASLLIIITNLPLPTIIQLWFDNGGSQHESVWYKHQFPISQDARHIVLQTLDGKQFSIAIEVSKEDSLLSPDSKPKATGYMDKEMARKVFHDLVINSFGALDFECPTHEEIEFAFDAGFEEVQKYGRDYPVDVKNIDVIKLFAFAACCFKTVDDFDSRPLWNGLLKFLQHAYKGKFNILRMPQVTQTINVLHSLAYGSVGSPQSIACYSYIKGLEEAISATLPT